MSEPGLGWRVTAETETGIAARWTIDGEARVPRDEDCEEPRFYWLRSLEQLLRFDVGFFLLHVWRRKHPHRHSAQVRVTVEVLE